MRAVAVLGVSACLGLTGCVSAVSDGANQLDGAGDVRIETVACASRPPDCDLGNDARPAGSGSYQLLYAVRVASTVVVPESVVATEAGVGLSLSPTYAAELQRLAPAPAGRRWAAYVSPRFDWSTVTSARTATLVSRWGLMRGDDGAPFGGRFPFRSVLGYRQADPDPARAVKCGDDATVPTDDGTVCVDWPPPDALASEAQLTVHDLGVLAGAHADVPRGGSGPLPFTVAYSGESAHPTWTLTASTSVPGGTASPSVASLTPSGAGSQTVGVQVVVPTTAPPGGYDVTLTARLASGQVRTATGRLTVTGPPPADRTPPGVTVAVIRPPSIAKALKLGVLIEVGCDEPCRFVGKLLHSGRMVGRGRVRPLVGGRRRLRIHIRRAAWPVLRGKRRVAVRVRVTARDASGNPRTRSLRVRLKR